MSDRRGREARLKPDFATLYPGIAAGIWLPVESLLRQVATMVHEDRDEAHRVTGERLLREDHFEYRGESPRPEGLPRDQSRLSDAALPPDSGSPS